MILLRPVNLLAFARAIQGFKALAATRVDCRGSALLVVTTIGGRSHDYICIDIDIDVLYPLYPPTNNTQPINSWGTLYLPLLSLKNLS